jgi:ElaB/YqjD/DUF883 family membrane-anchored ribosome-binding protein
MAEKSGAARISEQGQDAKNQGQDAVHDAVGAVTDAAGRYAKQAQDYAKQGYDIAAEKGKQVKDTTEHYITGNPWYAVGIALGVGVLLGLALRGGRD